jgi:hypothetical protein
MQSTSKGLARRMADDSTGFFTREAIYGASPVQAVGRFFVKYFNFRGRASMSEFWWVFGFLVLISVAIGIIDRHFGVDIETIAEAVLVNIHTLNFLDLGNQKMEDYLRDESIMLDSHSTKSAGVVKAIAEQGDVETYWALRKYLMQNQSNVYEKWEIGDFADAAKRLGADSSVVKAVEQVSKEDGNGIGRSNDKTLKEQTGTVSSPRVLQDGKDISQENIFEWVDVALK